jgi:hypothetical protein
MTWPPDGAWPDQPPEAEERLAAALEHIRADHDTLSSAWALAQLWRRLPGRSPLDETMRVNGAVLEDVLTGRLRLETERMDP